MTILGFIAAWLSGTWALLALLYHLGLRQLPGDRDMAILRRTFALGSVTMVAAGAAAWWWRI